MLFQLFERGTQSGLSHFAGMSEVRNHTDLLELCLWDLADGTRRIATTSPCILGRVGNEPLRLSLERLRDEVKSRCEDYSNWSRSRETPNNLWVTGLLEDALRDLQTLPSGLLLDIAIIGSTRKLLSAECASIETALALARELGDWRAEGIAKTYDGCVKRDRALRDLLLSLTAVSSPRDKAWQTELAEDKENA